VDENELARLSVKAAALLDEVLQPQEAANTARAAPSRKRRRVPTSTASASRSQTGRWPRDCKASRSGNAARCGRGRGSEGRRAEWPPVSSQPFVDRTDIEPHRQVEFERMEMSQCKCHCTRTLETRSLTASANCSAGIAEARSRQLRRGQSMIDKFFCFGGMIGRV
jgi:hypothetical protein